MPNELHIPVGTRVRLTQDFENYPLRVPAGETGVVVSYVTGLDAGGWNRVEVKMDRIIKDLEEWDNVLWVSEWLEDENEPPAFLRQVAAPYLLEVIT
jgi:hypothetical protein